MRPLTEEETKLFFEKLSKYIGENIRQLIDRTGKTFSLKRLIQFHNFRMRNTVIPYLMTVFC